MATGKHNGRLGEETVNPELEGELVHATMRAAAAIERKSRRFMHPWARRSHGTRFIFSVFEHVVVYEVAAAFGPALRRHGAEFEWEVPYASDYRYAHADFAVLPHGVHHETRPWWRRRSVVEVKWLYAGGGLYWIAWDALKLAWAEGSRRYVLAVGTWDADERRLGSELHRACREMPLAWRKSSELHAARRNLVEVHVAATSRARGLMAVLFDIRHRRTL